MKSLVYSSDKVLECQCDSDIYICVDPALTANGAPFIAGTLLYTTKSGLFFCGGQSYSYYLEYNENSLLDPTHILLSSEIHGILCKGCLTSYIEWLVQNGMGPR